MASELMSHTVFVIGDRFCLIACAAIYEFTRFEVKMLCEIKVCLFSIYTTHMSCRFHHLLTKAGQPAMLKKISSIVSSHTLWNLPFEEFLLHPFCWESILQEDISTFSKKDNR